MDVEFDGIDRLLQQLQQMESGSDQAKKDTLISGAKVMQKATQELVPVHTGNLKENIEISDVKNDEVEVYVGQQGDAYYGYFVEFGTSKMRARPFMGPAFQRNSVKIQSAMANSLRKKLGLS